VNIESDDAKSFVKAYSSAYVRPNHGVERRRSARPQEKFVFTFDLLRVNARVFHSENCGQEVHAPAKMSACWPF